MVTGSIPARYPLHTRDWLRSKWAIHPGTCNGCGQRTVVCWAATSTDERWWQDCPACHPPDEVVHCTFKKTGEPIIAVVHEVSALPGGSVDAPNLIVCVRPGSTIPAGAMARMAQSFQTLALARVAKAENPGWALELREFDRVWSPYDPCSGTWPRGDALPLRKTVLRQRGRRLDADDVGHASGCEGDGCKAARLNGTRRQDSRRCAGCKTPMGSGQTAWRADTTARPGKGGWSRDGLACLWCPSCVAAVQAARECTAGEVVVKHMRVIEGGIQ